MAMFKVKPSSVALALLLGLAQARADVVTDWNVTALGLTTPSPPPVESRALAITHAK